MCVYSVDCVDVGGDVVVVWRADDERTDRCFEVLIAPDVSIKLDAERSGSSSTSNGFTIHARVRARATRAAVTR